MKTKNLMWDDVLQIVQDNKIDETTIDGSRWWRGFANHLFKTVLEICPAEADDVIKQALQSAHDELR